MQIHERIFQAFPDAVPLKDFTLQDDSDGRGVFLAECAIPEADMIAAGLGDLVDEMHARIKEREDAIAAHAAQIEAARRKAAEEAAAAEQARQAEAAAADFDV